MGIESCGNLIFKRCKLQVDLLQHQDENLPTKQSEVTMTWELISRGRAMNCRSISTTPPSLLFRATAGFSSHGIHMSHSGHISEDGGGAGKLLLPLHPKLPCCSLNEGHNHSVCLPKQTHIFTPVSPLQQLFSYLTCEIIKNYVNRACIACNAPCNYINI